MMRKMGGSWTFGKWWDPSQKMERKHRHLPLRRLPLSVILDSHQRQR